MQCSGTNKWPPGVSAVPLARAVAFPKRCRTYICPGVRDGVYMYIHGDWHRDEFGLLAIVSAGGGVHAAWGTRFSRNGRRRL